jgi:hypothetical protein
MRRIHSLADATCFQCAQHMLHACSLYIYILPVDGTAGHAFVSWLVVKKLLITPGYDRTTRNPATCSFCTMLHTCDSHCTMQHTCDSQSQLPGGRGTMESRLDDHRDSKQPCDTWHCLCRRAHLCRPQQGSLIPNSHHCTAWCARTSPTTPTQSWHAHVANKQQHQSCSAQHNVKLTSDNSTLQLNLHAWTPSRSSTGAVPTYKG